MERIEKTVFICYRRTNAPWALAIFQYLNSNGYDVFFDFQGIASGDFERVILENIKARAHFLVLLTPSALERCGEPGDWLRREIETALDTRRNIVPLMLEGFSFDTRSITDQLTGKLAALKRYNALGVPVEYFQEAMTRLGERCLNVPLDAVLHPATGFAQQAAREQQAAASTAPTVQDKELSAQEWFEQGLNTRDLDEKLRCYGRAIHLKPGYAAAYYNRGLARKGKGDLDGALQDYAEAIRLKPGYAAAYYNRGLARKGKGDLDGALQDYAEAIRLRPDHANAYVARGVVRSAKGALDGALQDYTEAIRLKPDDALTYYNRGLVRKRKGDLEGAMQDYAEAIRLKPDDADVYGARGVVRRAKGDLDGALQDYAEAIRLKPDEAIAYYNRALVWEKKTRYEAAIGNFQKYLDLGGGLRDGDEREVEERIGALSKRATLQEE